MAGSMRPYLERLPRYLSMRQMRMLAAVAEHGSVLAASRALRVAQPSVSRTVTELENAIGVRLFDRSARGMSLTLFGEALLRRVKTIFGELRDAEEDLRSLKEGSYGHVYVGCTRLLSAGVLPRLLSRLMRARPGLNLSLVEADTETLLKGLRDRTFDIALGRLPEAAGRESDVDYELLFEEKLLIVAGTEHPMAQQDRVSLRDIPRESWGLPLANSMLYRAIKESFVRCGTPLPEPHVQADSVDVMLELVESGDVITLIPASSLLEKSARYRIRIIQPVEPLEYGPVGSMVLKDRLPTPAMTLFAEFLRAEMRVPAPRLRRAPGRRRPAQRADALPS